MERLQIARQSSLPSRQVLKDKLLKANTTAMNSTDALAMIEHGSEVTLNVTTPVGMKFLSQSQFIGIYQGDQVLIQAPDLLENELRAYFQSGFWVNVRALSQRGEGATIQFRTQIRHRLKEPLALLALDIPNTMQVAQLRKEMRYDVSLVARVSMPDFRMECELRDLSRGGCRFVTAPISRALNIGDLITLDVLQGNQSSACLASLSGIVCNSQKSTHYSRYGIQFDDLGKVSAKNLLSQLKFTGSKLTLRS